MLLPKLCYGSKLHYNHRFKINLSREEQTAWESDLDAQRLTDLINPAVVHPHAMIYAIVTMHALLRNLCMHARACSTMLVPVPEYGSVCTVRYRCQAPSVSNYI